MSLAEINREPEQFDWDLHYIDWLENQVEARQLEETLRKIDTHLPDDPFWDE